MEYLHLILTHSKGHDQDQGHAYFDNEYPRNADR